MKKLYLYRNIDFKGNKHPNPYILNLKDALSFEFEIVNQNNNKIGVLEPYLYLFRAKFYYFNWIETLPQNKFGKLQAMLFYFFLLIAKAFKKKIIWTLHNKYAHNKEKNFWNDMMYKILIRYSNVIITHSEVGVTFIRDNYSGFHYKVKYFIHPLTSIKPVNFNEKKIYDFLIWGEVHVYKGISEFLDFIKDNLEMQQFKILIIGKCFDESYKIQIMQKLSNNTVYYDQYYNLQEISKFASQSKFILFTYNLTSVLSSGSLMDSISMGATVIGPNDCAFKDLAQHCFIYNYKSFADIPSIYNSHNLVRINYTADFNECCNNDLHKFYVENTWASFGDRLNETLNNILLPQLTVKN